MTLYNQHIFNANTVPGTEFSGISILATGLINLWT